MRLLRPDKFEPVYINRETGEMFSWSNWRTWGLWTVVGFLAGLQVGWILGSL